MRLEHNIIKMHLLKAVMWFMVAMPIIVLFFQDHGLSLMQVMQLQATYSLTVALFELPSGYIADKFGRKRTIIFSTIFSFIGYIIFSFYQGFNFFLIAEILVGIGGSLMSGADSAILYDTLLERGEETKYTKVEGKNYAIGNFSESIAAILGGFLAIQSIYLPIYIQTGILFLSIPISMTLVEPSINHNNKIFSLNNVILTIKSAIFNNNILKWLIIYSAFMGVATLSIAWFLQPFFKEIYIPLAYFGILWAGFNFSAGVTSFNSHKISNRYIILYLALLMVLSFILLAYNFNYFGLFFVLIIYLLRGLVTPILKNRINQNTCSINRATILSVRSFIIRISFAIVAPFLGYIADAYSLSTAFLILAGIIGFFLFLSSYHIYKTDKKHNFVL